MKAIVTALISLVAVTAFANTSAEKHTTKTTTTTTAPATTTTTNPDGTAAPANGMQQTTTTTEKHTAKTKVDCKDAKNKEMAECKNATH